MISRDRPDVAAAWGDQTTRCCFRIIHYSGWNVSTGADFLGGMVSFPRGKKILLLHTLPLETVKAPWPLCEADFPGRCHLLCFGVT